MDDKTRILAQMLRALVLKPYDRISRALVVGCGDGSEAADLADFFDCDVDAIDAADTFRVRHSRVMFHRMDARTLAFKDGVFDLVYSFHAVEHIPQPERAIAEMRRVLCDEGVWIVGVPNRSRVLGYLTGRGASLRDKLLWNLIDWRQRLLGRFRNEYGAHAGFTLPELRQLCAAMGEGTDATRHYYEALYPNQRAVISRLADSGLARYVFPCLYCVGRRDQMNAA